MRAVYAVAAVAVAVAYALLVAVPQQGVQQPDSEDAAIEPIPLDLGEAAGTAPRHLVRPPPLAPRLLSIRRRQQQ